MTNTALRMRCVAAIKRYVRPLGYELDGEPCHVHPRGYVVARPALYCLVVAVPPCDSEPQVGEYNNSAVVTHGGTFDAELKVGDWCTTAYVSCKRDGVWCCGTNFVIPVVP